MIATLPYAALRAFEAVVRTGGFTAAASELGVGQSAVSQHVKSLEEWLGAELLVRGARKSVPTRQGQVLAAAVAKDLGELSDTCTQIRSSAKSDNRILVSAPPGFAVNWLFPRLLRFDIAHPEYSVSIATDPPSRSSSGAAVDLEIRYGNEELAGHHAEKLLDEQLFPVCAPQLVSGTPGLRGVADLKRFVLLHDEIVNVGAARPTWQYWAEQCDVTLPQNPSVRRFGQSNLVVQAAIEGMGVALGREPLVVDALADGRLVRPFELATRSPFSYWLVLRPTPRQHRKLKVFADWIRNEAAKKAQR